MADTVSVIRTSGGQLRTLQAGDTPTSEGGAPAGGASTLGYVLGARLAWVSVTQVSIGTTGQTSIAADSTGVLAMEWSGLLTAAITSSGANGLDTGSEASSTWYYVYVIGDTSGVNSPASLLSASATSPTLPSGYDVHRRVGAVRNDSGSDFIPFVQVWNGTTRRHVFDLAETASRVLTSGSSASFANVDVSAFVPSTSENVLILAQFETGAAGLSTHDLHLRPDGFSASTSNSVHHLRLGLVNSDKCRVNIEIPCPGQIIEYDVDDAANNSVHISVAGYDDEI